MTAKEFISKRRRIIEKFSGKRICVLCGGTSGEREVSIRSGTKVYSALKKLRLNAELIIVEKDFIGEILSKPMDFAFVIFHGKPGEDGTVQALLELAGIPYTGSGILSSSVSMNKIITKYIFQSNNIPTPPFVTVYNDDDIEEKSREIEALGFPVIIKPKDAGSSLGVEIIKKNDNLKEFLIKKRKEFKDFFVEKYIKGEIITTGVLGTGKNSFALPVLALRPVKSEFYDYHAKYTKGETDFILPAPLPEEIYKKVQEYSVLAHRLLECNAFSRVDGIVSRKGKIFILEVNTLPGMTDLSDLPAQAKCYGLSYEDLVLFILNASFE